MAKKARSTRAKPAKTPPESGSSLPASWSEGLGVVLLAVGALMTGGLISYQWGDGNLMGPVGFLVAGGLYAGFGMAGYLVAMGVLAMGARSLAGRRMELGLGEGLGFTLSTLAGCVLMHVTFPEYRVRAYTAGGLLGEIVGEISLGLFHVAGTYLVMFAVLCLGLLASTPLSTRHLLQVGGLFRSGAQGGVGAAWTALRDTVASRGGLVDLGATYDDGEEECAWDEDEDEVEEAANEAAEAEPEVKRRRKKKSASPRANRKKAAATAADMEEDETPPAETDDDAAIEVDMPTSGAKAKAKPKADKSSTAKSNAKKNLKLEPATVAAEEGAPEEDPEIVLPEESEGAANSDNTAVASAAKPGAKKAPPRAAELARAQAQKPTPKPEGPRESVPGVVNLTNKPYELPDIALFQSADDKQTAEVDKQFVLDQAARLVEALGQFKIKGKVTKIHPGPVITRYEFKPEAGVKLSRIENLENDIAMALEAIRIRILAPIPGKATVGFEVPNKTRETVYIKEILEDGGNFGPNRKLTLPLALGTSITGQPRSIDMAKAPHLLVAGATGSGKSVGVNSMICSLLYACSPEDVRMIMIDPKMLELSIYEGIPHLLLPVVTDAEKANLALRWAVEEMERRYALLSSAQVRDIAGFNRKLPVLKKEWAAEKAALAAVAAEAAAAAATEGEEAVPGSELAGVTTLPDGGQVESYGGTPLGDEPAKLPYIVVIIDEFADLMMVASKEVEQSVARIAAKARAAGIHLILATQRPSVDVVTGTIKNNFPSRIAFQVTSDTDSRTILDAKGAKQLLGMGDMLHMDRGMEPQRVHGCYVTEEEILRVVDFAKKQAKPVYNMDIVAKRDESGAGEERDESFDPLYDKAVQVVAETQRVSTSMIQRRLNVGYNRAAKIVEKMEEQGVIGPSRGTTPREVFIAAA